MIKLELNKEERDKILCVTRNICSDCQRNGYKLIKDTLGNVSVENCHCTKEYAYKMRYEKAGIGRAYWDWDINSITPVFKKENQKALDILLSFGNDMDNFIQEGKSLFIWGEHGTAKTSISLWLLKQALAIQSQLDILSFKYECGLVTLRELVNLLVEAQMDFSKKPLLKAIENLDLIFIDEFDKEHATQSKERFSGVAFGDIFNLFYSQKKSMIIASNFSLEQLDENHLHTDDVLDRLATFQRIKVSGSSHRKKDYKEDNVEWP